MYHSGEQQRFLRLGCSLTTRRRGNCNYLLMVFQSPHPSTTQAAPLNPSPAAYRLPKRYQQYLLVSAPPQTCFSPAQGNTPARPIPSAAVGRLGSEKESNISKPNMKLNKKEKKQKSLPSGPPSPLQPSGTVTVRRHQPAERTSQRG